MQSSSLHRQKMRRSHNPWVLAISFLVLTHLGCPKPEPGQDQHGEVLDKAIVRFVDMEAESFAHVDCESLDAYFHSEIRTAVLEERNTLDTLASMIDNLKPSSEGYRPDARMTVRLLYNRGKEHLLCLSMAAVSLDGQEKQLDRNLIAFLKDKVGGKR